MGVLVSDRASGIEFRLPGAYWDHYDQAELAERMRGGCGGGRLPPELLFVAGHKDAPAWVQIAQGPHSFLMRSKDDLETFVGGGVHALTKQIPTAEQQESSYQLRDGMIVHRFSFTGPAPAGGGCAGPGAGPEGQQLISYLFVDYFVRPRDQDAVNFQARCVAPAEVFEKLEPELEFIVSSFRYTGAVAGEFFVPDAPLEKVMTAEQAAKAARGQRRFPSWLFAAGMILVIWLMLRRRKKLKT